jgi:transcriptional regulator
MYSPAFAKNNDDASIKEFIKQNSFGILVSRAEQRLIATHIPLIFSTDETKLLGHISKANPQWNKFNDDSEVLVIFSGPHAYISSSWYDHVNVPTWNYIAVHVYGKVKIIEGNELYQSLKHLVDKYETISDNPVSIEKMPADYVSKSMKGLVGFEIMISSIEATYKLSQNRDKKNHQNIIDELLKTTDHGSHLIAQEMKKILQDAQSKDAN